MAFDWLHFLDQYHIDYVTEGPNVAKNNINTRCPFCEDDPSHHMGISLEGKGWSCWRTKSNPEGHRGKNPARLVHALLGCSYERAKEITGSNVNIPEDFMGAVMKQMNPAVVADRKDKLELLPDFKRFDKLLPSSTPFLNYLKYRRSIAPKTVKRFTVEYDIHYCTRGPYRGRIIFPVYHNGKLVSWTGRTIYDKEIVRYKTLPNDSDKAEREGVPLSIGPINNYLLWLDDLWNSDAEHICITEGPFDALKVDVLGRGKGIVATCLFGAYPTDTQFELLYGLLPRFKRRSFLLDRAAYPFAMQAAMVMSNHIQVDCPMLPSSVKDPGEITQSDLLKL